MRDHDVWVAVEGAAIGWIEVDRDRVAALYVSPSCSRRGVGSALLTFAETSIRNSGYTIARLESSQNALDYYLRRGYLRCGPADSDGAWPLRKDLAPVTPDKRSLDSLTTPSGPYIRDLEHHPDFLRRVAEAREGLLTRKMHER
jgi:GNAT superfamily N-acetyltransferase